MGISVLTKGEAKHYCDLPGYRIRKKLHIRIGSVVQCDDCHLRWQWDYRGVLDLGAGWVPVNT